MSFFRNELVKANTLGFLSSEIVRLSKLHGGCPTEKEKEIIKALRNLYDVLEKVGG